MDRIERRNGWFNNNSSIITIEHSLSIMNRISGQKIKKKIGPEQTVNHPDLTDVYRTFHPITAEYTFFSRKFGIFS